MTKINKIVMQGFKSFAKRTEIVFGDHFNSVLGPNGSGKSNVLDAICFVLGRLSSKSMRAEKSANLIYNGGKTKKPGKKASVSIYFDNSKKTFPKKDKEIKISRIVKKTGQSVYKINDKTSTRTQILDLLSIAKIDPDGYNIILQGDIIRFVEMSTVERRKVLEEISGISIYQDKKHKAMNNLNKVEDSLKEAEIILAERETYLNELKKERNQAVKYRNMKEKIDSSKATVLNHQIKEKKEKKGKKEKKKKKADSRLDKINKDISDTKKKIKETREEVDKLTKEIEKKGEKEQVQIMKKLEELRVDIATNNTKIENLKQELEKISSRREQLEADSKEITSKNKGIEKKINELEKKKEQVDKEHKSILNTIEKFKDKRNLGEIPKIEEKIQKIDTKAEKLQKDVQKLREEQQDLLREKDRVEYKITTLDDRIEKVQEVEKEHNKELKSLKEKKKSFKKITVELNKSLADDSSLAAQIGKKEQKLAKLKQELSRFKARSVGIKEKLSANIAIKKILEQKNKIKGIYGTVGELGTVSTKYSMALEVAAGSRLNNVVVKDDKVAAKCIKYLKKNKLGRATFLPLNKVRSYKTRPENKKLAKSRGCHGLAVNLVDFKTKYRVVFNYLFANTLVVDNITVARRIGVGKARMVTLDGDIAERSGAMTGGFRRRKSGLGFQEKETSKNINEIEDQVRELSKAVEVLEKRRQENQKNIVDLRKEKAGLEGEIIKIEKSLHLEKGDVDVSKKEKRLLNEQSKQLEKTIEKKNKEIQKLNKKFAKVKAEKQSLRNDISELQNPELLAELNTFEDKRNELKEELIQTEHEIKSAKMQLKEMYGPELEKIDKILKQLDKEEKGFEKDLKKTKKKVDNQETELKTKEKKQKAFYKKFKDLFSKRDKLNEKQRDLEIKKGTLEEKSRDLEMKINNYALKIAAINGELSGLLKEFEQYQGVVIMRKKNISAIKAEITRFENMVEKMGSVNLKALEIYDSVQEEYEELLAKKDKLEEEKADVLILMEEIESRKQELFMKTFDSVNEHFQNIFKRLTTKGKAHLALENPKDVFEGGVRIRVKLTGRRFMDIRSLSGGEKTLTALSLIFAVQEYDPASFYVLDEVDAALDKHNSEKLARLIRKYSQNAQYIIVSHNDAIIQEADNLYGVSMNEHSISKIISLEI
ncbi:MAG: Chromosome partition protein Smc [Candidatus Woesearchaeota archaeon]|nr:Chromosome partition protein Smc [Candidatus Woesearchaeota archaeon]